MRHVVHVDSAGSDIRRDQYANLFALEVAQGFLPAVLALIAVNRGTLDTRLFEHARYLVCTVLGAAEYEHLFHLGMRKQKFLEERSLAALVDTVKFLMNAFDGCALRRHLDPHRVRAQNRRGKLRDIVGHGRAEEQVLPILRKERHYLADIVDKTHIEHAVGLVEHEEFQRLQRNGLLVDKIQEAARSRHQHVDTAD